MSTRSECRLPPTTWGRASLRPWGLAVLACVLLLARCSNTPADSGEAGLAAAASFSVTEVAAEAGLSDFLHDTGAYGAYLYPETMGGGGAFLDFDQDGWVDILLAGGGTLTTEEAAVRALWLFRNNHDGTFTDATEAAGLGAVRAYGMGLAVADFDADGDEDFLLTTVHRNLLFRNEDGRFIEVADEAGVAGGDEWSTSAAFFDADRDGFADLYVANYVPWSVATDRFCSVDGVTKSYCTPLVYEGLPGRFYKNNGDGTFTERTSEAGFGVIQGKSLGVLPLDYDDDGWADLFIANDVVPDALFRNNGDGTFTERGLVAGIAFDERGRARAGMGVDAGEIDGSGRVAVFVGNFSNETIGVYQYTGEGTFLEVSAASQIGKPSFPTLTFGLLLFDVDLDGDLDLFAANGHVQEDASFSSQLVTYEQPPHLFLNDGSGRFRDVVPGLKGPLPRPAVARGAAFADFDRDGDVDWLTIENGGAVRLWRNESRGHGWLRMRLTPRRGGKLALGARVAVFADGQRWSQYVRTARSYLSASESLVTFGLGTRSGVDSIRVIWPDGAVQSWPAIDGNQEIELVQDRPEPIAARSPGA